MKTEQKTGLRTSLLRTAAEAGLWVIPRQRCLELLAACYVFGGGCEAFVFNERLSEAVQFAQRMIGVEGGEHPSPDDVEELKRLIGECGDFSKPGKPDWAVALAKEYKFELR